MPKKEPTAIVATRINARVAIIVAVIGLLGVLIPLLVSSLRGSPNKEIEYSGRIVDSSNQQPVANVKVTLDLPDVSSITYTDSEGVYRFKVAVKSDTSGKIRVQAQGFQVYTRNIVISPNSKTMEEIQLTLLRIAIPPSAIPPLPPTPTSTPVPTSPSATATLFPTTDPLVFRGIDQNCLSPSLWYAIYYPGESQKVSSRNCWDLMEWGIIQENGELVFLVKDSNLGQDIVRRLYTKVNGDAEIKFTVRIDQFTTNANFDGMLMIGVGDAATIQQSGFYIKFVVIGKDNKVYREVAPGLNSYYEPRSAYILGESQNIMIRITGTQANMLADGNVIRTASLLPDEHSVFWISYTLPAKDGSLIASISDLQIYDRR